MEAYGNDYIASPSEFARSSLFFALIGGTFAAERSFHFERSYFPAYEILLITSGRGAFRHGNRWTALAAGDCLLHDMRYPHAYKADPAHPFRMKYVVFDGHLLNPLWEQISGAPVKLFRTTDAPAASPFSSAIDEVIRLIRAFSGEADASPELEAEMSLQIYRLLLASMRQSQREHDASSVAKPIPIAAAHAYMNENYLTIDAMEEVASHSNLSYYHFIRQFKRYYGCTPKEFVLVRRVNHAKRLLLLTNDTVTEIAFQSGFNNYNAFLHTFRSIEKCSPTEYRHNLKLRDVAQT
jgi:AraC family transcriptional regulator